MAKVFNVDRALQSGMSEQEIQQFLSQNPGVQPSRPLKGQTSGGVVGGAAKVGQALGVGEFGTGLGAALSQFLPEVRKARQAQQAETQAVANLPKETLRRMAREGKTIQQSGAINDIEQATTQGLSNREVVGSALQTALLSTIPGGVTRGASGFQLTGRGLQPLVRQSLATRGAVGATEGALSAGAQAATEGGDADDIALAVTGGGGFGALLPFGLGAAAAPIKKAAQAAGKGLQKLPEGMFTNALSPAPSDLRGGQVPVKEFIERRFGGSLEQMKSQAKNVLESTEEPVQRAIRERSSQVVSQGDEILEALAPLERQASNAADATERKSIQKFFNEISQQVSKRTQGTGQLTLGDVDEMLRAMDKNIGDAFKRAKMGKNLPADVEARQAVAHAFRRLRAENLPDETQRMMRDRHIASLLNRAIENRETKKSVVNGTIQLLFTGLGAQAAFMSGMGFAGLPIGGALGNVLARSATSPRTRTKSALRLNDLVQRGQKAHPIERGGALRDLIERASVIQGGQQF